MPQRREDDGPVDISSASPSSDKAACGAVTFRGQLEEKLVVATATAHAGHRDNEGLAVGS
ncbi:hypothetical protein AB0N17_43705 [Streptomyces sp. NPDC051133]|uniref:hypothetical protein n=1 Tax=Streptomyces sp. NPDC051133 TaxID=3155521 RepID=UPI0034229626